MKKIVGFLVIAFFILVSVHPAPAQQSGKIYRIGIYQSGSPGRFQIFLKGLRDLGYIEGQNLMIEWRYGTGNAYDVPKLMNELVQQKVDVIFVHDQRGIRAAIKATKTIPIVMRSSIDPVAAGYVDSLARPGGNITGVTGLKTDLIPKRTELLKEVVPTCPG